MNHNNNDNLISIVDTTIVYPINENDKKCAPGINFEVGSCIKLTVLIEMANAYNDYYKGTTNIILLDQTIEILNPRKYKKYLLNEFNKRLSDKCQTQKCWSEQSFIIHMKDSAKDELLKYTFRPDGPNGKFEWLNTINIVEVMDQYETKDPSFKFLGAVPIDFDDFDHFGIKNLNYKDLINNEKYKLGFVFNLDEHDQPGSHWVALYSDLKKGEVYFFDSYGTKPVSRIRTLMRRIAKFIQVEMSNTNLKVDNNKIRHQYENSECGVYSINFIIRMLKGDSFESICKSKISDNKINKCRNVYFNNTNI